MTAAEFRAWREARGLTQKQLAAALGIPQQRVSEMERGAAPVRPQTQKLLAAREQLEGLTRGVEQ